MRRSPHDGRKYPPNAILLALLVILIASPGEAARFHVSQGGTRLSGPSELDNWDAANNYATLAEAFAQAAPADSILLDDQIHALDTPQVLTALLTNRSFDAAPGAAGILVGSSGSLRIDAGLLATEIRGLVIAGTAGDRDKATISVDGAAGIVVILKGCQFHGLNGGTEATGGGSVLRASSPGSGTVLEIADCTFDANRTRGYGGALYVGGGYDIRLHRCTFTDNTAVNGGLGGAVAVASSSSPSLLEAEDCLFDGNTAAGPGGALNVDGASVVMRRCRVLDSRSGTEESLGWKAGAGMRIARGGGHVEPVTVLLEDCEFRGNQGSLANNGAGDGGGVLVAGGGVTRMVDLQVNRCVFQENFNAQGAGLYMARFCEGTVTHSRFLDNIAWYQGGGAFKGGELPECAGELATFAYCEFRGNRAGFRPDGTETGEYSRGGGLGVRLLPRAEVYNCTFVDNLVNTSPYRVGDGFAHTIEGGQWQPENLCTLVNCAFWGDGNDVQVRSEGTGGMALVANVAVPVGEMSVPGVADQGTVWLTELPFVSSIDLQLRVGSPLIDAGIPVAYATDLAGMAVPVGVGFDIGCYEMADLVGVDGPPLPENRLLVHPNPFNPRTSLAFTLVEPGLVNVQIHDPRGRVVRELWSTDLAAGRHALLWDGRDDRGRDVAAGVYLARLQVNGRDAGRQKLSLVR